MIWPLLRTFAKSNEGLILYEQYKQGFIEIPKYWDMTLLQRTYFNFCAAEDITYKQNLDVKLTALCEAAGIKFKQKKR